MIVGRRKNKNNFPTNIIVFPSHYHMLNIKKEKENKNKKHTSMKNSDETFGIY